MNKLLAAISLLFSISTSIVASEQIKGITIRNSDFEEIHEFDPTEIDAFKFEWDSLTKLVEAPNSEWTHKIDITGGSLKGRWLYNSEDGVMTSLNYFSKPCYRVTNIERFNTLLLGDSEESA